MTTNTIRKNFIWFLTKHGFGSEFNNLLYAIYYCRVHNSALVLVSQFAATASNRGWLDYFEETEMFQNIDIQYSQSKINKLFGFDFRDRSLVMQTDIRKLLSKFSVRRIWKYAQICVAFWVMNRIWAPEFPKNWKKIRECCDRNIFTPNSSMKVDFTKEIATILEKVWILNSDTKNYVEQKFKLLPFSPQDSITIHVRRGDKLKVEAQLTNNSAYIMKMQEINPDCKNIFLMTDDYNVYTELKQKYPSHNVFTFCQLHTTGFNQDSFAKMPLSQRKEHTMQLIAEIEIANRTQAFIGTLSSNIFRLMSYFQLPVYNAEKHMDTEFL